MNGREVSSSNVENIQDRITKGHALMAGKRTPNDILPNDINRHGAEYMMIVHIAEEEGDSENVPAWMKKWKWCVVGIPTMVEYEALRNAGFIIRCFPC
jgi:hypothetical protein